jgi:hypothetical protein
MTKKAKEAETETNLVDPKTLKMPGDGYTEVSGGDRVAGFFIVQAGNAIAGVYRGFFEVASKFNKGEKKRVHRIEITSDNPAGNGPTLYHSANSAVAEDFPDGSPAGGGELIGIDEKGFLQSLRSVQEGQEVWIACLGKEAPSEEFPQGAWKFKVMAKPLPETA